MIILFSVNEAFYGGSSWFLIHKFIIANLLYDFMVGEMTLLKEEMVDSLCYLRICAGARKGRIIFCRNGKFKKQTTKTPAEA